MKTWRWVVFLAIAAALIGCWGCGSSSDDDDDGLAADASYAGTYTGKVGGRDLILILHQKGTSLTGSYTLNNPDFSENLPSGSVASKTPPATAILTANNSRHFEITFSSYSSFSGVFINLGKPVSTYGNK